MKSLKRVAVLFLSLIMFTSIMPNTAYAAASKITPGNRVYFYNMSGNGAVSSDFIIVESKGQWGLIDTGHRYEKTIADSNNKIYSVSQDSGLSSQVKNKYGLAAVQYMVNSLGVTHLDFIVGTHSHSDHIGGVPEIANYTFKDSAGAAKHLVDNNTVFFYKEYNHVNDEQDDINRASSSSWHNQAFAYQAKKAMLKQGCVLVDVSNGLWVSSAKQKENDYFEITRSINRVSGLSAVSYSEGNYGNYYDDNITFSFGDMRISLYNLFMHQTTIDENVNSIVAAIVCDNHTLVSLADINVENRAEQSIAKAINERYGQIDIIKAAHHGVRRGSNSKELFDLLQPKFVVATRGIPDVNTVQASGAYANAMYYAKPKYGTVFYEVGASDYALVADMSNKDISMLCLSGSGRGANFRTATHCINNMSIGDGWSNWDIEWGNTTIRDIYYFLNGSYKNGWVKWNGKWFYLNNTGIMQTGWQKISNTWYYFIESQKVANDYGAAALGWQSIDGRWYYFNTDNSMQTGWLKSNGKWYYLNSSGTMQTGWVKVSNVWYYLNSSGVMQTGWLSLGGKRYYLNSSGKMVTGSQRINGKLYYFLSSGALKY